MRLGSGFMLTRHALWCCWSLSFLLGPWLVTCRCGEWKAASGSLTTPWTKEVSPDHPLPEYPRPQMVRSNWLNLNGLWNYAVTTRDASKPAKWQGNILVPFPIESALSGVMQGVTGGKTSLVSSLLCASHDVVQKTCVTAFWRRRLGDDSLG